MIIQTKYTTNTLFVMTQVLQQTDPLIICINYI